MRAKLLHDKAVRQKRVRDEESEQIDAQPEVNTDASSSSSTTLSGSKRVKKSKLSTVLKGSTKPNQKLNAKKKEESNVVYIGHLPNGFFEKQMYSFFGQFGTVLKLKHFRNPKTNQSRGYAFIRFELPEVAAEVATAMNGYFLNDRQLKCEIVPIDRQHEGMFLPPKKRGVAALKDGETATGKINDDEEDEDLELDNIENEKSALVVTDSVKTERKLRSFEANQLKKQEKLSALGINYDISLAIQQS